MNQKSYAKLVVGEKDQLLDEQGLSGKKVSGIAAAGGDGYKP